jgi:hypothetical protein
MCSDPQRLLVALLAVAGALAAQAPPTAERTRLAEALALAFPGGEYTEETRELDAKRREQVVKAVDAEAPAKIVRHVAKVAGKIVGYAYVDRRTVRTHGQALFVAVDAAGKLLRVELVAFDEPRQYRPRAKFYAQFEGKVLDDKLQLRAGIQPVAGATLSARAAVDAVRLLLAVHAALEAK